MGFARRCSTGPGAPGGAATDRDVGWEAAVAWADLALRVSGVYATETGAAHLGVRVAALIGPVCPLAAHGGLSTTAQRSARRVALRVAGDLALLFRLRWLTLAVMAVLGPAALATAAVLVLGAADVLAFAERAAGLAGHPVLPMTAAVALGSRIREFAGVTALLALAEALTATTLALRDHVVAAALVRVGVIELLGLLAALRFVALALHAHPATAILTPERVAAVAITAFVDVLAENATVPPRIGAARVVVVSLLEAFSVAALLVESVTNGSFVAALLIEGVEASAAAAFVALLTFSWVW